MIQKRYFIYSNLASLARSRVPWLTHDVPILKLFAEFEHWGGIRYAALVHERDGETKHAQRQCTRNTGQFQSEHFCT